MKLIPLTRGLFAQVDDEDFERVSQLKWHARKQGKTAYALRAVSLGDGRQRKQYLHVFIANTPPGMHTHHINCDGLDNQRKNLRVVTPREHKQLDGADRAGTKRRSTNTSGYRGVHFYKSRCRWQAYVRHFRVGYFDTAEEAARARDVKARELGWPESGMNFPI